MAPSLPIVVVLRVLLAVGLLTGLTTLAAQPVERSVAELMAGIRSGEVSDITIERWDPDVVGGGALRVTWTQDGRAAAGTYEYSTMDQDRVDEGAAVLRAARVAGVPVTTVSDYPYPEGWTLPAGPWTVVAALGTLLLLAAGDQPRIATKWAWFWLGSISPLWIVFLLLEPLPLWATRPHAAPARRLTGGWAFLLTFAVLKPLVASFGPEWAFLIGG